MIELLLILQLLMQGLVTDDVELGRDPNLIKCTDNYQDDVDCKNTRNILNMFKKMESRTMGEDSEGENILIISVY